MMTSAYQSLDMCASRPRTAKHLTERKRRARINDSLLQLKSMVFPAVRKDISRHPKMEKADILEMTVRYLKEIQSPACKGKSEAGVTDFHAGFTECLSEVSNFMVSCEGIDIETRLRLLGHLADRCSTINDVDQKPDVSRLQSDAQQQRATPSPSSTVVSTPASSPVSYVAAPTHSNGMVILVPAHAVQTPTASPNSTLSVQVPASADLLTPPQSPASPTCDSALESTSFKMSQLTNIHSHRSAPYKKRPLKAAANPMWRPW